MKILVFIKQIPGAGQVKLDPKTGNIIRSGAEAVINPLDLNAIEAALSFKRSLGAAVTAISMGPPQAESILRKALALGCDEAVLLSDRAFAGADTLATAYTLAKAAEKAGDYDLLIFGQNSADGDTAQVAPATAAFLDLPQITGVLSAEVRDGWVYCRRSVKDRTESLRAKLPAVISVSPEINRPGYALPRNILRAAELPIKVWNRLDIKADSGKTGSAGSPSATKTLFTPPKPQSKLKLLKGSAKELAVGIADILENENII